MARTKRKAKSMADGATILVENPLAGPTSPLEHKFVKVDRAFKDDPLGQMHGRGQISELQYLAARQFQRFYEQAGSSYQSPGDIREFVDSGSRIPTGITDRQMQARDMLCGWEVALGKRQYRLLEMVLADKLTLWGATSRLFPNGGNPRRTFVGHWFRDGLTLLAKLMGLAT